MMSDDDELGLAPIEDDDAGKIVAADLPFDTKERLIPVICSACRTRLYAGESQIGLWKKCPDCGRLSEILAVPEKFMLVANDPEAAGGYEITGPAISRREIFQLRAANQQRSEAAANDVARDMAETARIASVGTTLQDEEVPPAERILNRLLKTDEEKAEERQIAEKAERIRQEAAAVNRAVRDGRLEEYLAKSKGEPDDVVARKLAEKQRLFDAAVSPAVSQPRTPPIVPPPVQKHKPPVVPPPLPSQHREVIPPSLTPPTPDRASFGSPFGPLLDARFRPRLMALLVCGLVGNFFGEKAWSMIWQVVFDKVYEQYPGYIYTTWENVKFISSFYIGAFFMAIWLTLLFLFGISLFLESASGRDRVENWSSFDLNFGCSYIGWTLLIFFVSGYPGASSDHQWICLHCPDIREIAPVAFNIHAESDDKAVGQGHADMIRGYRFFRAGLFVSKYGKNDLGRAHFQQAPLDMREGFPFVKNVIQHNNNAVHDILPGNDLPDDFTAMLFTAIAGNMDKVEFQRKGQPGKKLACKNYFRHFIVRMRRRLGRSQKRMYYVHARRVDSVVFKLPLHEV